MLNGLAASPNVDVVPASMKGDQSFGQVPPLEQGIIGARRRIPYT